MSGKIFATKNEYLKSRLESFSPSPLVYESGKVSAVGDGVATVTGLKNRLYGELLEFDGEIYGMALDLNEDGVGAVLFDSADAVSVGDKVKGTNRVAEIPVGPELLGRIIDPIGRAIDGKALEAKKY